MTPKRTAKKGRGDGNSPPPAQSDGVSSSRSQNRSRSRVKRGAGPSSARQGSAIGEKRGEQKGGPWTLYIIETDQKNLYTGITLDLERRFREHAGSRKGKGARYFHLCTPERVLYTELHPDRSSATRREAEIKKMSKKEKLNLIRGRS